METRNVARTQLLACPPKLDPAIGHDFVRTRPGLSFPDCAIGRNVA